jgi:hypothetical protein
MPEHGLTIQIEREFETIIMTFRVRPYDATSVRLNITIVVPSSEASLTSSQTLGGWEVLRVAEALERDLVTKGGAIETEDGGFRLQASIVETSPDCVTVDVRVSQGVASFKESWQFSAEVTGLALSRNDLRGLAVVLREALNGLGISTEFPESPNLERIAPPAESKDDGAP